MQVAYESGAHGLKRPLGQTWYYETWGIAAMGTRGNAPRFPTQGFQEREADWLGKNRKT